MPLPLLAFDSRLVDLPERQNLKYFQDIHPPGITVVRVII